MTAMSNIGPLMWYGETDSLVTSWSGPDLILSLTESQAQTAETSYIPNDKTGLTGDFFVSTGGGTLPPRLFVMSMSINPNR